MTRSLPERLPSIPNALLLAVTVAVVVTILASLSTSSVAFSIYNSDWDGASSVRSAASDTDADVVVAHETTRYTSRSSAETVAFVLSPDSAYSATDAARVTAFVRSGGTLVVADNFGPHANDLLRKLGASARLDGRLLRDARSNYRSSAMPVASPVANRSPASQTESLTLNHGTAVEPNGATPLFNTTENAYLDADRSGDLGENETLSTYTVVSVEPLGEGRVVVVGDPSVFINAMLEVTGNRQFAVSLLDGNDSALFDYSNANDVPPLVLTALVVRESPPLQFGIGVLVVVALLVWSRRSGIDRGR